jgi:hypothetical protein
MMRSMVLNRVIRATGCDSATAHALREIMRQSSGSLDELGDRRFDSLAWEAFAEYRYDRLRAGEDDPLWDLAVGMPVGAEGGAA